MTVDIRQTAHNGSSRFGGRSLESANSRLKRKSWPIFGEHV